MKVKNVKLNWNAYYYNFNKECIECMNIFYGSFPNQLYTYLTKIKTYTYDNIKQYILDWAQYNYWSKVEYELYVCNVINNVKDVRVKIDVYNQICINIDRICEYIIKEMEIDCYEK